jgi:hypothetical protein
VRVIEQAVAVAKVLAVGAASPLLGPAVAGLALRSTARTNRRLPALAGAMAAVTAGADRAGPFRQVGRLPAGDRVVVTSDLHRCVPGRNDWPRRQGTVEVYEAMLDHYGEQGWRLVEAGDVEDFWMVGGSPWGARYDIGRLAGAAAPTPALRARVRSRVYRAHLDRIVANYDGVYDRIHRRFHLDGRYHRLVGNHDDAYRHPEVAEALRLHHPGLDLLDALVIGDDGGPQAFVAHGHHSDAWNAPSEALLGRIGTWMGCMLSDLPWLGLDPGTPPPSILAGLLDGGHRHELTAVSRWFGADRELYSMDEVLLFDAVRRAWPSAADDDGDDPLVVFGHTHLPLVAPVVPGGAERWWRYANVGCGVFGGAVTALEWDGPASVERGRPVARLVAWCAPEVAPPGSRPVGRAVRAIRVELGRAGSATPAVH